MKWTKASSSSNSLNPNPNHQENPRSDYYIDYDTTTKNSVGSAGSENDLRQKYTSEAYVETRPSSNPSISSPIVYPLEKYKIQQDPFPIIIRKFYPASQTSLRQNITVRYFRPPPLPEPGPLIVREIRPPQIPPAPPLVIRQRPPNPPPDQLPIILRERPPQPPAIDTNPKIVRKQLPALPPPPRQLIIERYPQLPPKPRDVIIERWLPYSAVPKRRVIYQRARETGVQYAPKKNMIIQYEFPKIPINRIFQREHVIQADPAEYAAIHQKSLMDSVSLEQNARKFGVVEDISIPNGLVNSTTTTDFFESLSQEDRHNLMADEVLVNDDETNLVGEGKDWSSNVTGTIGYDSGIYMPAESSDYKTSLWSTGQHSQHKHQ